MFEPIVLGLLLAPSLAGFFLSAGATGVFLARHPFKLAVGDRRRNRCSARTAVAERFALLYCFIAALALALALKTGGAGLLLPLLLAAPLALVQWFNDSLGRSRAVVAELAGSIATGALATAITISGGWPRPAAFGLWVILAARSVPTILYLRARIRILHRKPAAPVKVIVAHLLAILIVFGLAEADLAPLLPVAVFLLLLLRALFGFSRFDMQATPKKLGLRELGFGAVTIITVVVGHAVGW